MRQPINHRGSNAIPQTVAAPIDPTIWQPTRGGAIEFSCSDAISRWNILLDKLGT
jgi:hypothetical protein